MRRVLLWAVMAILFSPLTACISYTNFYQGMTCFKGQQYRAAFIHLKPEANKGQPDAQYAIGYMYYYGKGVVEDRQKAWMWINRAAEAGQPDAIIARKILIPSPH